MREYTEEEYPYYNNALLEVLSILPPLSKEEKKAFLNFIVNLLEETYSEGLNRGANVITRKAIIKNTP